MNIKLFLILFALSEPTHHEGHSLVILPILTVRVNIFRLMLYDISVPPRLEPVHIDVNGAGWVHL